MQKGGEEGPRAPVVGSLHKKTMQGREGGSLESVFHGHGASFVGFGIQAMLSQALLRKKRCVARRTGVHPKRDYASRSLRCLRT